MGQADVHAAGLASSNNSLKRLVMVANNSVVSMSRIKLARGDDKLTSGALVDWLSADREFFAPALATRIALRVLPIALFGDRDNNNRLNLFRTMYFCWASQNLPSENFVRALDRVEFAVDPSTQSETPAAVIYQAHIIAWLQAAPDRSEAVGRDALFRVATAALVASKATANENVGPVTQIAHDKFWDTIEDDCNWLERQPDMQLAARKLSRRKLWPVHRPSRGFSQTWEAAKNELYRADPHFGVWTTWYDLRVAGERSAFIIPGDSYRREDKTLMRKLAWPDNPAFWDQGFIGVNETLADWLDDARERAGERVLSRKSNTQRLLDEMLAEDEIAAEVPSQTRHAVQFGAGPDGKVAIDTTALADALKTDAEAQDRHAEAIELAKAMLAGCEGSNAGARMTTMLTAYLAAAGDSPETMRPSLFVQRGERLRQELAGYEAPDTMLAPLADTVLSDAKSWRSAHNMVVGLDPVLNALDTAQLGPDAQPTPLAPSEIRHIAQEADNAGALEEGVKEVVVEAADLAPETPDPNDRRTIWSSETAKNLVIEAFSVALNHPIKSIIATGTGAVIASEPATALVATIGVIPFLFKNRAWIENRLGSTPTWRSLFQTLCQRLDDVLPDSWKKP